MTDGELELTLDLFELPLKHPWTSRKGTTKGRWSLLVRVHTDGITGWGEAPLPLRIERPLALAREAAGLIPRLYPGEAFAARTSLDHAGLPGWMRHGIINALMDHAARTRGVPLARFLADAMHTSVIRIHTEPGQSVPVNGNVGIGDAEQTAQQARRLVDEGTTTLKVKSLGDARVDEKRLSAIRDAVGDEIKLRLDVNGAWNTEDAFDALQRLAPFNLEYIEEPLGDASLEQRARLNAKSPVGIAWDESVNDQESAEQLAPGAAALVVKPPRLGGVDRFLPVLAAAHHAETHVVVSTPLEGAIGRAVDLQLAALCMPGTAHGLGTGNELDSDLADPAPLPHRGHIQIPEGVGIGTFTLTTTGKPLRIDRRAARSG